MARNDILGGLKVALSKGHSLQEAMQSFYNAGYKKEDIEEAARLLQSGPAEIRKETLIRPSPQNKPNPFVPKPQMQNQPLQPTIPLPVPKPQSQVQPVKSAPILSAPNQESQYAPPQKLSAPSKEEVMEVFSQQKSLSSFAPQPALKPALSQIRIPQQPNVKQNVSAYGEKRKVDTFTIILIVALVVLLGILTSVFLFKDQFVEFLNGILD
ncbi:MAG: hypothetical protein AABW50_01265 [Nanoarchaeota archaeon]